MVSKIVIVLVALALLVWLVLGSTRRRAKDARAKGPAAPEAKPAPKVEGMVVCARCGVHLPASQALLGQGRPYCCVEHRDGGPGVA
jgi:uncharacterized protein